MATEKVTFKKGTLDNLPAAKTAGTIYVTTDERAIYLDVDASTRIRLGDFQEFATLAALQANTNRSTTALYYITELNCLAKWDGTEFIQINLDTGATSAEVVGDGNAVTAVSYDPTTRKLTLTKGETFAKAADATALGARVTAVEENITTLNGDKTVAGSVAKQVADAVAAIVSDAPEAYDTLKEISDWISSHASDASSMNTQITTNKTDIAALKTLVGTLPESTSATTVVAYIDEVIAGLSIGDYAKAADLTAAVARIATLEDKAHEHSNKTVLDSITAAKVGAWDAAEQNAKTYTDTALTWGTF